MNNFFVNASIMSFIGMILVGYKEWAAKMWGEDDDEPDEKSWAAEFFRGYRDNLIGLIPAGAELSEPFLAPWRAGESPLSGRAVKTVGNWWAHTKRTLTELEAMNSATTFSASVKHEREAKAAFWRSIESAAEVGGFAAGIPIKSMRDLILGDARLADLLDE